jgi:hypothetical protein
MQNAIPQVSIGSSSAAATSLKSARQGMLILNGSTLEK